MAGLNGNTGLGGQISKMKINTAPGWQLVQECQSQETMDTGYSKIRVVTITRVFKDKNGNTIQYVSKQMTEE